MLNKNENNFCRICGLDQKENPWGEDNNSPNFSICSCCGCEFGYYDVTLESIRKNRNRWLANGAKWFNPKEMPLDWSLEEQLKDIPKRYI